MPPHHQQQQQKQQTMFLSDLETAARAIVLLQTTTTKQHQPPTQHHNDADTTSTVTTSTMPPSNDRGPCYVPPLAVTAAAKMIEDSEERLLSTKKTTTHNTNQVLLLQKNTMPVTTHEGREERAISADHQSSPNKLCGVQSSCSSEDQHAAIVNKAVHEEPRQQGSIMTPPPPPDQLDLGSPPQGGGIKRSRSPNSHAAGDKNGPLKKFKTFCIGNDNDNAAAATPSTKPSNSSSTSNKKRNKKTSIDLVDLSMDDDDDDDDDPIASEPAAVANEVPQPTILRPQQPSSPPRVGLDSLEMRFIDAMGRKLQGRPQAIFQLIATQAAARHQARYRPDEYDDLPRAILRQVQATLAPKDYLTAYRAARAEWTTGNNGSTTTTTATTTTTSQPAPPSGSPAKSTSQIVSVLETKPALATTQQSSANKACLVDPLPTSVMKKSTVSPRSAHHRTHVASPQASAINNRTLALAQNDYATRSSSRNHLAIPSHHANSRMMAPPPPPHFAAAPSHYFAAPPSYHHHPRVSASNSNNHYHYHQYQDRAIASAAPPNRSFALSRRIFSTDDRSYAPYYPSQLVIPTAATTQPRRGEPTFHNEPPRARLLPPTNHPQTSPMHQQPQRPATRTTPGRVTQALQRQAAAAAAAAANAPTAPPPPAAAATVPAQKAPIAAAAPPAPASPAGSNNSNSSTDSTKSAVQLALRFGFALCLNRQRQGRENHRGSTTVVVETMEGLLEKAERKLKNMTSADREQLWDEIEEFATEQGCGDSHHAV
jgi:hypothetical protein